MSIFLTEKYKDLKEYVPGEQPKDMSYVKLNTNESPFPPHKSVIAAAEEEAGKCHLYSDPECSELTAKIADYIGVGIDNVLATNGSDEILNFAFMAYGDKDHPFVFPDITYGFYPVFAGLNGVPFKEIPLKDNFEIDANDYIGVNANVVIANPNAPTGLILGVDVIENIVASNPDNVVVIDEAYIDFGGVSAVYLTKKYKNLLVTRTFSKSFSLAGARLGFGVGDKALIDDLKKIKYSTNPYNVNRMTAAAGASAIDNADYFEKNCALIQKVRDWTTKELLKRGFKVIPSSANFLFIKHDNIGGEELYVKLKQSGILVRHFSHPKIAEYNRVTVGKESDMTIFIKAIDLIFGGRL